MYSICLKLFCKVYTVCSPAQYFEHVIGRFKLTHRSSLVCTWLNSKSLKSLAYMANVDIYHHGF